MLRHEYPSLRQGLIGAWCPSLGMSGYTLLDRSPFNRNAAFTAPSAGQWVGSPRGLAVKFDGTSQYASTTIASGLSGSFTFAAWVNPSQTSIASAGNVGGVVVSRVASYTNYWANLGLYQAKWNFALYDGSNNPVAQDSALAVANAWSHIVGKRDRATGKVHCFVNGIEVASTADATSAPAYGDLQVGAQSEFSRFTPCQISDARVWSRALTPAEVLALYTGGPGFGLRSMPNRRAALPRKAWVNVGGTWKNADAYVNVGGVWKLTTPSLNVGGTWK